MANSPCPPSPVDGHILERYRKSGAYSDYSFPFLSKNARPHLSQYSETCVSWRGRRRRGAKCENTKRRHDKEGTGSGRGWKWLTNKEAKHRRGRVGGGGGLGLLQDQKPPFGVQFRGESRSARVAGAAAAAAVHQWACVRESSASESAVASRPAAVWWCRRRPLDIRHIDGDSCALAHL